MPKITYYRIWCKTCNNFTLHHNNICKECNTKYSDVYLKDIPPELLEEQRIRYKNKKFNIFDVYLNIINPFSSFMTDVESNYEIIESDAGQKIIDEETNKLYKERKEQLRKDREWTAQYKGLQRNEQCLCGSGKKYKHCCYSRVSKIH